MTPKMKQNSALIKQPVIGVVISVMVTVLLSAIVSWLIANDKIEMEAMDFSALVVRLLAALIGCAVAARGEKGLIKAVIAAIGYLVILVCINALFFDGRFTGILGGVIAVAIGCAAAVIVNNLPKRRNGSRRRKR